MTLTQKNYQIIKTESTSCSQVIWVDWGCKSKKLSRDYEVWNTNWVKFILYQSCFLEKPSSCVLMRMQPELVSLGGGGERLPVSLQDKGNLLKRGRKVEIVSHQELWTGYCVQTGFCLGHLFDDDRAQGVLHLPHLRKVIWLELHSLGVPTRRFYISYSTIGLQRFVAESATESGNNRRKTLHDFTRLSRWSSHWGCSLQTCVHPVKYKDKRTDQTSLQREVWTW